MKTIKIKGTIVTNEDKWIYDFFEIEATCPADVEKMLEEAAGEEVTFMINSCGGDISAGSEIWYMISQYAGNTVADIVGYACSAASYLAMGADRVRMVPTALMMIHCVSSSAQGNHNILEKEAEVLRVADKAISNVYKSKTGLASEKLISLMEKETWMDAEKALELGFIDEIIVSSGEPEGEKTEKAVLYNAFGNILSESVKEKIRNMVKHPAEQKPQDLLLQEKLNLLKLSGGKANEI